jgi:hypothetical protein
VPSRAAARAANLDPGLLGRVWGGAVSGSTPARFSRVLLVMARVIGREGAKGAGPMGRLDQGTQNSNAEGLSTTHETRRRLVYADNTDHPVLVPFLGWASGQISGAYYLLTETMGYESDLLNISSLFDDKAVNFVAGCLDSADNGCQN